MKLLVTVTAIMLSGCASQQWAQQHWNSITNQGGITPGYRSGVSINQIQVNGKSYQVVIPQR